MNPHRLGRRGREFVVLIALALLVVGAVLAFFVAVAGAIFLAPLIALGVLILIGVVHYFVWGRTLDRRLDEPWEHFGSSLNGDAPKELSFARWRDRLRRPQEDYRDWGQGE
jgi:hypothetical protein